IHGTHAAAQSVGRLHGDGPDAVLAEVLFDFDDDLAAGCAALLVHRDAESVVDFRQVPGVEFDVDDRPDDLNNFADVLRGCCGHQSASAPETTSMISLVIAAWRTLFMCSVRLAIMSAEFFVAVSIAVI